MPRAVELFSVHQFFPDGTHECVRSHEAAVQAAQHYCHCVGAQIGTTVRVVIIDSGDCIAFEWKHGEGVVYPPREAA